MKNRFYLLLVFPLLFVYSCKKDDTDNPQPDKKTVVLQGGITSDMTLNADSAYLLKGQVYVKNNATLTVPAGVTVEVEKVDNADAKGALIVTKGSKLVVNGTADMPVVFTSAAANKAPGDWIGIVILGNAPTNLSDAYVAGLAASADTQFGGSNAADNSGSISYLRIAYSGGLNPPDEDEWEIDKAAGLSLQGVGSGTVLDHIVVHSSLDDGFQFVGGTVNAKYLVAAENGDDNFDFDRGYTGKLQFAVSYHSQASTHAIRANGMESLNDKNASAITPYTRPVISNMTIIGPEEATTTDQSQGVYIRKNTRFFIKNSIIAGYSDGALMLCTKTKPLLLDNQASLFEYNLVHCDDAGRTFMFDSGPSGTAIVPDPGLAVFAVQTGSAIQKLTFNNNTLVQSTGDLKIKSLYAAEPDLSLQNGATALAGADFSGSDYASFFTKVDFKGAMGAENWAAGNWVKWK